MDFNFDDAVSLLDNMSDKVALVDNRLHYVFANRPFADMLHVSPSTIIGKPHQEIPMPPVFYERILEIANSVFETRTGRQVEFSTDMLGGRKNLEIRAILSGAHNRESVILCIRDIADQRQLSDQRNLAHENYYEEKSAALDEFRNDFVSLATHELRSPLASIVAFAQTLLSEDIHLEDQERKHFLEIIESEAMRLGKLLGSLLDITRIETGSIQLFKKPVDIAKIAEEVLDSARKAGMTVSSSIPESQIVILGDPGRLRQVISNLIENAAGLGDNSIEMSFERVNGSIEGRVFGSGPEIPQNELPRMFDKFHKTKVDRKRKRSGLGLAITKGLIEAHGGKIWAQSERGKGNTIFFRLPLGTRE